MHSLVSAFTGMLALCVSDAWALDEEAHSEEAKIEEVVRGDRPEKPPIVLVESGPFKMKDKRGYRNLIILGPRLLPPGIGGRYIRSIDEHLSLMVGGGYAGWELFGATLRHVDLRAGLDYQPIGNGLHGFYVGPRVVYRSFIGGIETDTGFDGLHTSTIAAGGVVGWRFIWDPGVSLGIGLGGAYSTFIADAGAIDGEDGLQITGTLPLTEFTLGFAF